ncbi:uncharacterized protein DSM5745_01251 [Aspergillus mulundensis]|uniref:Uncharacterized protein n=1 Tax=Aspergillus mulundensis TaxID=1810919 RepID=A0A3D8T5X0_9EURO|nr:hypothetical protein DSM5745_01251 [Aspergillus mulundensis]RDW93929.1 hypothetical protein DSM5745_01251 [Aspergillus mulundensis]
MGSLYELISNAIEKSFVVPSSPQSNLDESYAVRLISHPSLNQVPGVWDIVLFVTREIERQLGSDYGVKWGSFICATVGPALILFSSLLTLVTHLELSNSSKTIKDAAKTSSVVEFSAVS